MELAGLGPDLLGSLVGTLARADEGAILSSAQFTADAGGDALLALERAQEQSATLRWLLFQRVIAGLRSQVAEALDAAAEAQRHEASLDRRIEAERMAREAADAILKADVQALALSLQGEIRQGQLDTRATIDAALSEVGQREEAAEAGRRQALEAQLQTLQRAVRDEELARHRAHDEVLRCFEELRGARRQEAEARTQAVDASASRLAEVEAGLAVERAERAAFEARVAAAEEALGQRVSEASAQQEQALAALRASVAQAQASLEADAVKREEESLRRLDAAAEEMDAKLAASKNEVQESLAQLADLEPRMHRFVKDEVSALEEANCVRDTTIEEVAQSLQRERAERQAAIEEAARGATAAAEEVIGREAQPLNGVIAEHSSTLASLAEQLKAAEASHAEALEALRADASACGQDLVGERRDREAAVEQLAAAEAAHRGELAQQLERSNAEQQEAQQQARLLVDRVTADLRAEREARVAELQAEGDGRTAAACSTVREALAAELERLDAALAELREAHAADRREERARCEVQAGTTAEEVRAALEAHGEFAEELEREVRDHGAKLKELTEGVAREGEELGRLSHGTRSLEHDMQKIRGHLPLLFATFR